MKERDFLLILQKRAQEQKRAMDTVPFPKVFRFVIEWLSDHPWRFLIPLAFLISLLFRGVMGSHYTDAVLFVFRSL
ncbi:MAG: hypothetical protein ACREHC_06610 [Candidatus Levyibacteriota bacterium]